MCFRILCWDGWFRSTDLIPYLLYASTFCLFGVYIFSIVSIVIVLDAGIYSLIISLLLHHLQHYSPNTYWLLITTKSCTGNQGSTSCKRDSTFALMFHVKWEEMSIKQVHWICMVPLSSSTPFLFTLLSALGSFRSSVRFHFPWLTPALLPQLLIFEIPRMLSSLLI